MQSMYSTVQKKPCNNFVKLYIFLVKGKFCFFQYIILKRKIGYSFICVLVDCFADCLALFLGLTYSSPNLFARVISINLCPFFYHMLTMMVFFFFFFFPIFHYTKKFCFRVTVHFSHLTVTKANYPQNNLYSKHKFCSQQKPARRTIM